MNWYKLQKKLTGTVQTHIVQALGDVPLVTPAIDPADGHRHPGPAEHVLLVGEDGVTQAKLTTHNSGFQE